MPIPEERRNKPEDQNATDTKIATNFLLLSANHNQEDMDDASIKDRIKFLSLPKEAATAHRQRELRTNRNLLKYLVFGVLTCGIYCIWQMIEIGKSLDELASNHAYRKTPNYLVMSLAGLLTFTITEIFWFWIVSTSIDDEGKYRNIKVYFTQPVLIATIAIPRILFALSIFTIGSSIEQWGGMIAGITFILLLIGGIIAIPTLMHDMNALCADYNRRLNEDSAHEN